MAPMTMDGAERLHPVLRAVATTRTEFSPAAIKLIRGLFNERRREAAKQGDESGVRISEDTVTVADTGPEFDPVSVRIYRGGPPEPGRSAPMDVYCHAGGF